MASAADCSNKKVLLLFNHRLLLFPLFVWILCSDLVLFAVVCVLLSLAIILMGEERARCFSFAVFLISCRCFRSLTFTHLAMGFYINYVILTMHGHTHLLFRRSCYEQ